MPRMHFCRVATCLHHIEALRFLQPWRNYLGRMSYIRLKWIWEHYPPPSHGFLILKPLYGTRAAPLRWFMKLRKALIRCGLRRLKSDIFMYSRLEKGELAGALVIHVGDILYVGNPPFIATVESEIKQFRSGEPKFCRKKRNNIHRVGDSATWKQ